MLKEHRQVITKFISYDIDSINMYWGYKGDYILKIITKDVNLTTEIEDYCKDLNIQSVTKFNESSNRMFTIYCIAIDEDVILLK
jgi:hypothetical protein